jgi:hypothetical protein
MFFQSKEKKIVRVQADDPIGFIQLLAKSDLGVGEVCYIYAIGCLLV